MTIDELIRKYSLELGMKEGKEGIRCRIKPTAKDVDEIKEKREEIIAELHRRADAQRKRDVEENAKRETEKEGILSGEIKIVAKFYDGEYLQGYMVTG